jgi:hypothetical protein
MLRSERFVIGRVKVIHCATVLGTVSDLLEFTAAG